VAQRTGTFLSGVRKIVIINCHYVKILDVKFLFFLTELVTEPTRQRKHGFDCVTCDEEFQQTDEWWEHLASPAHRRVKNQLGGGLKYFKHTETVMLRGLLGISRMDILRFAGSWGPVQDLLYQSEKDGAGDSCYVRFESS